MILKYRGISYEINPAGVAVASPPIELKFLGHSYYPDRQPQSSIYRDRLQFLGQSYIHELALRGVNP